jgi:tetratricopeptide (TPR) repeat protein
MLKLALILTTPWPALLISSVPLQAATGRTATPTGTSAGSPTAELTAQQRIASLIRQLGDEQYALRKQAQEELSKFGAEAFDQLVAAQDDDDIEIAARARYLVHHIRVEWVQDTDSIQVKEVLKDYDNQEADARLACMRQLAALSDVGLQGLCRVIRFEKSPLMAKQGALLILATPEPLASAWPQRARQIVENLRGSTRTAARWLRAYVRSHEDPEASLGEWSKLVDEELAVAEPDAPQVETQVQTRLLRWQADLLLRRKHRPEALEVMQKLLARQSDDVEELIDFVDWLVAKEAWEVVDATATRFEHTFATDRSLLYTLAQAQKVHGNEAAAQRYAQQAFDLASNADELDARLEVARSLRYRGMLAWSEREYRQVMSVGVAGSEEVLRSGFDLSEMLHDLDRDGDAADVLHKIVDQTKGNGELQQRLNELGHPAKTLRARMHFFAACQFLAKHDQAHQVEELDQALEADPTDADTLIAVYHLSDQTAERHKQTADLIREAAEQCQNDMNDQPDQPGLYNQYAWLISNTEGDLDRALDYAKKAVEMAETQRASVIDVNGMPNVEKLFDLQTAEVTDTLAHCYAAKKDYAAAVRSQTRAVELDPHSLQIQHAMEQFRKQLAESKPAKP